MSQKSIIRTKSGHDTVPSFIRKTYEILEERKFPDVVDWNPEGTALVISKPADFCSKVLPAYFKHNQLTSFVRQLNLYNFHKRRTINADHVYNHELFQRGKIHLLKGIKRKSQQESPAASLNKSSSINLESSTVTYTMDPEAQVYKNLYHEALAKISDLEARIKEVTSENQNLQEQIVSSSNKVSPVKAGMSKFYLQKNVPFTPTKSSPERSIVLDRFAFNRQLTVKIPRVKLGMDEATSAASTDITNFLSCDEQFGASTESCSNTSPIVSSFQEEQDNFNFNPSLPPLNQLLHKVEEDKSAKKEIFDKSPEKNEKILSGGMKLRFGTWSLEPEYCKEESVPEKSSFDKLLFSDEVLAGAPGKRNYEEYGQDVGFVDTFFNSGDNYGNDMHFMKMEQPRKGFHTNNDHFSFALDLMDFN